MLQPNMFNDMMAAHWFVNKVQSSDTYAQNLYAAMCNMQWQKREVMPILTDRYWSASWRGAGGIVSKIQGHGDYMSWYCSGLGDGLGNGDPEGTKDYVSEGTVTEEIEQDLAQLGWQPVPYKDEDLI